MIFTLSEYDSVRGFAHFMSILRYSRLVHAQSSLRKKYKLPFARPKKFSSMSKLENVQKSTPDAATE
jgi:hypothetical protein